MTVPERFETRSFRFATDILKFYRKLKRLTDLPTHIANQLVRAGTAIGANIEEAKSAYSRREMACKYGIALKEAREARYWLRLIKADQPQMTTHVEPLLEECSQFVAMLTTTVRKLKAAKREAARNSKS
jgi:four helix bundle protein